MGRTLENLRETHLIDRACAERFLPLARPEAIALESAEVTMAGASTLRGAYRIARLDPWFHVLIYTVGGRGRVWCGAGERLLATPGTLLILPAHTRYLYELAAPSWRIVWFHLRNRARWRAFAAAPWMLRAAPLGPQVEGAAEGMLHEHAAGAAGSGRAITLYAELLAELLAREAAAADAPLERRLRERLRRLWARVDANLAEPWTVAAMARLAHMSAGHLHRIVATLERATPMDVVFRLRMARAESLLRNTDDTIYQVAARVGYENPYAFSTAFRRRFGRSPSQHREAAAGKRESVNIDA